MNKIKVVILGGGVIASKYLDVLKDNKTIILAGICSRTFSKAEELKKKYKIKNNFFNIKNLYEKTKADIVISTVSVDSMYITTKELLKYPWTIFIEKPPGLNFEEFKKLQKISNKKNKKIYVGMNRRYFSSTLALIKKINKDKSSRTIQIFDQQNTNFEKLKGTSKRAIFYWMYANSIHTIDYANFLTRGNVNKINFIYKNKKELNCFIYFSSKDIVNYVCRWNKPGPWQIKLSNKNYYFELSPLETLKIRTSNSFKTIPLSVEDKKYKTGFYLQVKDLILAHKKMKNYLPTINDLEKTMFLIKKIYQK